MWTAPIECTFNIPLLEQMLTIAGSLLWQQCHPSRHCRRTHWHIWYSLLGPKHRTVLSDSRHFNVCITTFHTGTLILFDVLVNREIMAHEWVRFEALKIMNMSSTLFWGVSSSGMRTVQTNRKQSACYFAWFDPEDGGSLLLQSVSKFIVSYMTYPGR